MAGKSVKYAIVLILQDRQWHASNEGILHDLISQGILTTHHTQRISELILHDGFNILREDRKNSRGKTERFYKLVTDPSLVAQYIQSQGKVKPNFASTALSVQNDGCVFAITQSVSPTTTPSNNRNSDPPGQAEHNYLDQLEMNLC